MKGSTLHGVRKPENNRKRKTENFLLFMCRRFIFIAQVQFSNANLDFKSQTQPSRECARASRRQTISLTREEK